MLNNMSYLYPSGIWEVLYKSLKYKDKYKIVMFEFIFVEILYVVIDFRVWVFIWVKVSVYGS